MQFLAVEPELQGSLFERIFRRLVAFGRPVSAIPDHDRATAVLSFGNGSLEVSVPQRVIFDFYREAFFLGVERGSASHGP